MVIDNMCFEKEVNPIRMRKNDCVNSLLKKHSFMYIVSFFSSLNFAMFKLYGVAGENWIVLCKGFGFELFFLFYFWGFIPLNGIQTFIESEAKRTKIGETAANVVLFDLA